MKEKFANHNTKRREYERVRRKILTIRLAAKGRQSLCFSINGGRDSTRCGGIKIHVDALSVCIFYTRMGCIYSNALTRIVQTIHKPYRLRVDGHFY